LLECAGLGLGNSGAIATACAVCSGAVGGNRVSCEYALKLVFRLVVVGHGAAALSVVRNP